MNAPRARQEAEHDIAAYALEPMHAEYVVGMLRPDELADPRARAVVEVVSQLVATGDSPSRHIVAERVEASAKVQPLFVHGLGCRCSHSDPQEAIEDAVRTIRTANFRTDLNRRLGEYSRAIQDATDPEAEVERLVVELEVLLSGTGTAGFETAAELAQSFLEDQKRRAEGKHHVIRTGITGIDLAFGGGMEPGSMVVLAARPGVGKSAWAATVTIAALRRDYPCFWANYELTKDQNTRRFIAGLGGTTLADLKRGAQGADVIKSANRFGRFPFVVNNRRPTLTRLIADARRWRRGPGKSDRPGMILVDYLQLVGNDRLPKNASREQVVADVSRQLKALALDLGCVVVALAQLNRESTRRADNRPQLSDIRESGALEQDADAVVLLHRPWLFDKSRSPTEAFAIFDKNREDPQAEVRMHFAGAYMRFSDPPEGSAWQ